MSTSEKTYVLVTVSPNRFQIQNSATGKPWGRIYRNRWPAERALRQLNDPLEDLSPVTPREMLDCQIAAIAKHNPELTTEQISTLWAHNAKIRGVA